MTSIYAILRPVCLFGTLYLCGGSWSSIVGLDRDSLFRGFRGQCVLQGQSGLGHWGIKSSGTIDSDWSDGLMSNSSNMLRLGKELRG